MAKKKAFFTCKRRSIAVGGITIAEIKLRVIDPDTGGLSFFGYKKFLSGGLKHHGG